MRSGRELALAVLLLAAGGGVLLLAAGQAWGTAETTLLAGVTAPAEVPVSGAQAVAGVPALGLVGLAGAAGIAALRGWGRVVAGTLLALGGLAVAGSIAVWGMGPWPLAALAGALAIAAGGALAAARGRTWPGLGARYERPQAAPRTPWEALDRGEDPTAQPPLLG